MNIFKKKLEESNDVKLPIDPIELYQRLFHKEGYAYLRGIQEEVLGEWHKNREKRDILCKMNTGSGKTLVSLLMLYSKMVEGVGTALYLCPDKQLLEQAKKQAQLYGIPVCEIEEKNQFPADFHNCKSILLCTFQRLFNPRNIFDRDNVSIGSVVIDDAHNCLDIARTSTTIQLPATHDAYKRLIKLFERDLIAQAPGTYRRLIDGDPFAKILKVPYWVWLDRESEVISLLSEYATTDELQWKWGLIADELSTFDCYVGPRGIEIAPTQVPYYNVKAFNEAKHRYILSATFEDQIDLIKDFGIDKKSITTALIPRDRKDVGQRLILAPKRFDPSITDSELRAMAVEYANNGVNVVVLVASSDRALPWHKLGAKILNSDDIIQNIEDLKKSNQGLYVLINRYDGVDLSGDMCRLLIIDGYPAFISYRELYTEMRLDSVKASLKAQIIEQGLGRAVRSGSDFCTVLLMGNDLLQFLGNKYNLQFFTSITRKQLELGLSLLDGQPKTNSLQIIKDVTNLCLEQNDDWRQYHSNEIATVGTEALSDAKIQSLDIAQIEKEAVEAYQHKNYEGAKDLILKGIIDKYDLSKKQKAWYFQYAAQLYYLGNKSGSADLQLKANHLAPHMLQSTSATYSKIHVNEEQATNVIGFIKRFEKSHDLKIFIDETLSNLQFSPDIPFIKFENALAEIGTFIGYNCQEPENEYGNGPDVLWGQTDNHYLIMEAKSMATHTEITRDNIGQLLQSGEWFKKMYGTTSHTLVTLQSPSIKGWNVNPSENSKVIDNEALEQLRNNVSHFVNGLTSGGTLSITIQEVSKLLNEHNFVPAQFRNTYLKNIVLKKK